MLLTKIRFAFLALVLTLLCGCYRTREVYTCPFGVGYITKTDYETLQDPELISDDFITWLLATNLYCEETNETVQN